MTLLEIERRLGVPVTFTLFETILKDLAVRHAPNTQCKAFSFHYNPSYPPYGVFHDPQVCAIVESPDMILTALAERRAKDSGLKLSFLDITRTQQPNATT
jgi:hypothetical protein